MDPLPLLSLGLVDGLNICSLGLLGLFLSLMYATQTDRKTIMAYGAVYIGSVFLSYVLVGLGATLLFITLPTVPHFLARIAAAGMLAIWVTNIINYYRPDAIPLKIESVSQPLSTRAVKFMKLGGAPTAFDAVEACIWNNSPADNRVIAILIEPSMEVGGVPVRLLLLGNYSWCCGRRGWALSARGMPPLGRGPDPEEREG